MDKGLHILTVLLHFTHLFKIRDKYCTTSSPHTQRSRRMQTCLK